MRTDCTNFAAADQCHGENAREAIPIEIPISNLETGAKVI
jgi:hypothetical protein